jgi:hypothetical protein
MRLMAITRFSDKHLSATTVQKSCVDTHASKDEPAQNQACLRLNSLPRTEKGIYSLQEAVHGKELVFRKGNRYTPRDVDGKNGGAWKMA